MYYKGLPSENQSDNAQTDVKGKGVGLSHGFGIYIKKQ